jgi:hypothetical protein
MTSEGEQFTSSAVQKQDLDNLYTTFPALRPMSSAPLLRETLIEPGQTAEGMVLLHFPVTKDVWNHRRSAILHIDLYHQGPISIAIPQDDQVASKISSSPEQR